MEQILLFTALGLGGGALIASIGLSLVMTYRGSGTINIAAGSITMLGAYVFYGLRAEGFLIFPFLRVAGPAGNVVPALPAVVYTLVVCAAAGLALHQFVLRPLRQQSPLAKLVATVGVLVIVQAYVVLAFGTQGKAAPDVLPDSVVKMFGGSVPVNRLALFGIVVALTALLAAVYRWTPFGLATRAAQEKESEAALSGLSADRLARTNTVVSCVIAGGLGVFVAPLTQLDPTTIALAVVPALGAALLARFTSFGMVTTASIGMGVLGSLVLWAQGKDWFPTSGGLPWPGVTELLYFLIIAVVLLLRGQTLPGRGTYVEPRLPSAPVSTTLKRSLLRWGVVGAIALFVLPYDLRQALILTFIGAIACLSLVLLTGYVGQVSLVHYALAGIAGLIVSRLSTSSGIGFPWSPLIGTAAAMLMGLVMALPALRVRGVQLAILTLAAAQALTTFGFQNQTWGAKAAGSPVQQPSVFGFVIGTDSPVRGIDGARPSPVFGLVCLVALLVIAWFVARIRNSVLGKSMLAVRSNERAAAAAGISARNVKLTAFALSALIVSVAGVLYGYNFSAIDPGRFTVSNTLTLIAFAYIGGITTVRGAVMGGLMITQGLFSYIINHYLGISITYQAIIGGVLLIVTIVFNPDGIALASPPRWPGKLRRRLTGHRAQVVAPAGEREGALR